MASASKVKLSTSDRPVYAVADLKQESADKVSELLQENHDKHHIFFNNSGFHNHIAHHLLTIYALGATPDEIKKQYDLNASYQRPPVSLDRSIVQDMSHLSTFRKYLGDEDYYRDFLLFFQQEIEEKGWENVLNEYVFSGDERADDMLVRMFGGFLHPIIHLGFGVEFRQPAIMAEALAQAAVHTNWMGDLLLPAESSADKSSSKTLFELLEALRGNNKVAEAAHEDDGNKLRDGVIGRAKDEMVKLAAQYVVKPEELDERTAEMINFVSYFTSCAQRPPKRVKFDFFYIHSLNSSIFFPALLGPTSPLSTPSKCRLLEWKARTDLAMYASRGTPNLLISEVENYVPKNAPASLDRPANGLKDDWPALFARVTGRDDDGHISKLVRALANGEQNCKPYYGGAVARDWKIRRQQWITLGHMAVDSVDNEDEDPTWVRSCGFASAWENIGERGAPGTGAKVRENVNGHKAERYEDYGHVETSKF